MCAYKDWKAEKRCWHLIIVIAQWYDMLRRRHEIYDSTYHWFFQLTWKSNNNIYYTLNCFTITFLDSLIISFNFVEFCFCHFQNSPRMNGFSELQFSQLSISMNVLLSFSMWTCRVYCKVISYPLKHEWVLEMNVENKNIYFFSARQ